MINDQNCSIERNAYLLSVNIEGAE
jgi:hypothetical protein